MKKTKTILKQTMVALFTIMLATLFMMPEKAEASHFRYGNISWTRTGTRTVQFQIQQAWRRSFSMGAWLAGANVGDTRNTGNLNLGTGGGGGTTMPINLTVTSIDAVNDWFFGTATITYTYGGTGTTFTPFFEGSFRLSDPPDGPLLNNGDAVFRVESRVNLTETNGGPVSTLFPIVTVQTNQAAATFNVPAVDPQGRPLTWALSTPTQMGGAALTQPAGLSINAATGAITFNTVGKAAGNLYSASVRVRNNLSATTANCPSTTVDFLILVIGQVTPPFFVSPTPLDGNIYQLQPGQELCFTAKAQDNDPGSTVSINVAGAPVGGSFTPSLPTSFANPTQTQFCWTPTASDLGVYLMNFTATDNTNAQASTSVTLIVSLNPYFITPPPSMECLVPNQAYSINIEVATPNPGGTVEITSGVYPGTALIQPGIPSGAGTSSSIQIDWTPLASEWGVNHFQFTATDDLLHTTSLDFDVVVNIAPVISSSAGTSPIDIYPNQLYTYDITVNDPDIPYGDEVEINAVNIPAWLTLVQTGDLTATLSGTPTVADAGTFQIHIQALDKGEINCSTPADEFYELIVNPCAFTVNVSSDMANPICPGATVTLTADGGDAWLWNTGEETQSITVLPPNNGNQTHTVNAYLVNCPATASITLDYSDTEAPVANCQSISVNLDANGNATISENDINNGSTDNCAIQSMTLSISDFTCSDVGNQTVTLTVTDVNGNSSSCNATVTVAAAPVTVSGITKSGFNGYGVRCNGGCDGTATVNVSGICLGNVTYQWSNSQSSATATGLCAGTYTVTVTDVSGNQTTLSTTLTEPPLLTVYAGLDEQTFYGYTADQLVSHTAVATGGAGGNSFSWSLSRPMMCNQANSNGDESFTAGTCTNNVCGAGLTTAGAPVCSGNAKVTTKLLADGTLCVTVTDANGCTATDCFFINSIDARCFAGNSGNAKVKVCHKTASNTNPWVQICIADDAVPAHLAENNLDCIGVCPCGAKMANSTATSDFEIAVYPNPTGGSVNIDFDAAADYSGYELSLIDITGRLVLNQRGSAMNGGNRISIPANSVLPGVYNLMLKIGNRLSSVRLVVSN